MNYQAMSDLEINKEVAKARGGYGGKTNNKYSPNEVVCFDKKPFHTERDYCKRPADAWPIILESRITITPYEDTSQGWFATTDTSFFVDDGNPLRAAMIVYLMSKEQE